ncbi:WD repeat, SAM and U-box domain-containing protein 1-like isoform X2 [Daktulosphaira vitifoliae]|uniref:WD repeat, SAM and U-box domain-containing protein 1-like isoform X2 n=1 Tax=Daktulosphaira vitifoliae TaxID=58002 RepID=UPI0021A98CA8|nr:WD repeat, SAM and U-box domain-containing protein 1-like isoform X2 [Daktulosphaira vitifoliae]
MSSVVGLNTTNIQTITRHSNDVTKCCFSKRFQLAISSSDRTVSVWKWCSGQKFVEESYSPLTHHKYMVSSVQFNGEGTLLATSSMDGNIALCDVDSGKVLSTLVHNSRTGVRSSCFTSDYKCIISAGDDGTMCIWDLFRKSLIRTLSGHEEAVSTICCSKDSRIVVTGDTTGVAKIWSISELTDPCGKTVPLYVISGCHDMGVSSVDVSPINPITNKGKIYNVMSSGSDHLIKHWQVVLWKCNSNSYQCAVKFIKSLKGHSSIVTGVCFNHDGKMLASTSMDKTIRLWQLDESNNSLCCSVLEGHNRYVNTCVFSEESLLLATGSNDKSVIIWDVKGDMDIYFQMSTREEIVGSSINDTKAEVSLLKRFNTFNNAVNSCDFSIDNKILIAAGRVWNRVKHGQWQEVEFSPLRAHHYSIQHITISMCSLYMASCSLDGITIIWDLRMFEQKGVLHADCGGARCCSFSGNSKLIAVAYNNETIFVWNIETLQLISKLSGNNEDITCVTFSPDSYYLMAGCVEGHFRIWSVHPQKHIVSNSSSLCQDNAHDIGITTAHFAYKNPSIKHSLFLLTGGNDGLLKTWRMLNGQVDFKMKFIGHGSDITCAKFPQNTTTYFASTSLDKTARIWQTKTGECLHVIDPKNAILTCCSFSSDNRVLATGSLDKTLFLWNLPIEGEDFTSIRKSASLEKTYQRLDALTNIEKQNLEVDIVKLAPSIDAPEELICPITQQIFRDPVICSDGHTYERDAIVSWFRRGKITSPLTNEPLLSKSMKSDSIIKKLVTSFEKQNQS